MSVYSKGIKRLLDVFCSVLALVIFCWLFLILAILVRIKLGSPVIYKANRIGKNGKSFELYKFRSMTNEIDENGKSLPDSVRLTKFGRIIRALSLDELPEAINILKGDMSVIGPRPMPIVYKSFFTEEEFHRHDVRPGLSGWAQVHGRNSLSWDDKFALDLWYIHNISFKLDVKIVFDTVIKAVKRENIGQGEEMPISLNIERSDWLITNTGAVNPKINQL